MCVYCGFTKGAVNMRFFKKSFIGVIILACILICNAFQSNAESRFNIKGTVLQGYSGSNTSVLVPNKIKVIGKKAFADNKKVKKIIISDGVTQIKSSAFKGCTKLKKIEISASVKKIASNAFDKCKNLTIITQKGTYALKFAKKKNIPCKIKNSNNSNEEPTASKYNITGIECYMYTAGTYPCYAEKKIVVNSSDFDKIYESLLLFDSGIKAENEDMISGGRTLRVIINFSDKESRTIECNPGVYMEGDTVNKLASNISISEFWDSIEGEITEEIL